MYGLAALAILIIILLYTWYNKRRKRIKRDAENSIRESKLKTSQKVHDVVANGLYTIMNELEHRPDIEREPLMNKIEGLYEKSRNISYEDAPEEHAADYDSQVHGLLTSFANEQTKVFVIGNQPVFWNRVSYAQKHELQLILNELMVNMKKHSNASTVSVKFRQEGNRGFITYKDDGRGLPEGMKYGNGLQNTVNRIKTLHGEITFGKNEKAGVSIEISFPLEPRNS
jgi:signal transduction histidine kinase